MNDDNLKTNTANHSNMFTQEVGEENKQNFSDRINFLNLDSYFNKLK